MQSLLAHPLVLVGGKGGVGKTTVAAALAMLAAQRGKRTLVVSTDPAHSLGDAFSRELEDRPRRVLPGLDAMEIDPDSELESHLKAVMDQMRRFAAPDMIPELERQLGLARQSPGTQEAALLERIARLITRSDHEYDLIIFDTAPTGHTLRLLSLPEAIAAWTDGLLKHNRKSEALGQMLKHLTPGSGRDISNPFDTSVEEDLSVSNDRTADIASKLLERRRLFHRARRLLTNNQHSAFVFVLTPERLPVLETSRAVHNLEQARIPVEGVIVNRVLPPEAGGAFMAARRRQEAYYLEEIDRLFDQLSRGRLPLFPNDINGIAGLEGVMQLLNDAGY